MGNVFSDKTQKRRLINCIVLIKCEIDANISLVNDPLRMLIIITNYQNKK